MNKNTFTGNNSDFLKALKKSISKADKIDILVSFLMKTGVELIIDDLKNLMQIFVF